MTARQQALRFMQLSGTPILTLRETSATSDTPNEEPDGPDGPPAAAA